MTGLYLTNNHPSAPLPKYTVPHTCHLVFVTLSLVPNHPHHASLRCTQTLHIVLSPTCHPVSCTQPPSPRFSQVYSDTPIVLSLVPNYTQTLLFFVMQSWAHVNVITTRHRVFISACVNASICRPFNCVLVNEPQSTTRQKIPHIPSTYLRVSHVSSRCTLYIQCTVPSPIVLSTPVCHF